MRKNIIIGVSTVIVIIVSVFIVMNYTNQPTSLNGNSLPTLNSTPQPDISGVQVLNWTPNWALNTGWSTEPPPSPGSSQWNDVTMLLDPSLQITIKNPTQYTVNIKIYGECDLSIMKQGNNVGSYSYHATQSFSIPPYSQNDYKLSMMNSQNYLATASDNIDVTFNQYSVSELWRGTGNPP